MPHGIMAPPRRLPCHPSTAATHPLDSSHTPLKWDSLSPVDPSPITLATDRSCQAVDVVLSNCDEVSVCVAGSVQRACAQGSPKVVNDELPDDDEVCMCVADHVFLFFAEGSCQVVDDELQEHGKVVRVSFTSCMFA